MTESKRPTCPECGSSVVGGKVAQSFVGHCVKRGCSLDRAMLTFRKFFS